MELSRRAFLGGVLALSASSALPTRALALLPSGPRIVGDGIHDDAAGLQAAFDGEPFVCEGAGVRRVGGMVILNRGTFRLSRGLVIRPATQIIDSTFIADNIRDDAVLYFPAGNPGSWVTGINIHGPTNARYAFSGHGVSIPLRH